MYIAIYAAKYVKMRMLVSSAFLALDHGVEDLHKTSTGLIIAWSTSASWPHRQNFWTPCVPMPSLQESIRPGNDGLGSRLRFRDMVQGSGYPRFASCSGMLRNL